MQVPSAMDSVSKDYGLYGQETLKTMKAALKCEITYDASSKEFTILNSKHLTVEAIRKILGLDSDKKKEERKQKEREEKVHCMI